MSKDPAVLFYTSDFLVGVSDMPFLERGYYITLLCLQHQKGHLPAETICFSLGLRSVIEIPLVMSHFKVDDDGKYYQKRMEEESIKRCNYTESRRNNGKNGGRPKDKHMHNHMATHMENENINENIDSNTTLDSKQKQKFEPSSKAYQCAKYLDNKKGERLDTQASEDQLQKWSAEFEKTNRLDKKSWELIEEVLIFSQEHSFWKQQILSGVNFRKHFERMQAQTGGK